VWSEGSGLFDLSNLKAGDKSRLESMNPSGWYGGPAQGSGAGPNLLTNNDDLNKLWEQSSGIGNSGFGQPAQ
jgi:hypothetical protein